jgi:putative ABC transport system permease protein
MHGTMASMDAAIDNFSEQRIMVSSRASSMETLPIAHRGRIESLDEVAAISPTEYFSGFYQEPSQSFGIAAVDLVPFLALYPEVVVPEDQLQTLLRTPTGISVGAVLAQRYGWALGDRIPLISRRWTNTDGSRNWTFEIIAIHNGGILDAKQEFFAERAYIHYEYLDSARAEMKGTTLRLVAGLEESADVEETTKRIDALFENSSNETHSLSEKQLVSSFMGEMGNMAQFVNAILGAVLFTLLFMTATTMGQSVRERIPELGVLRSIGFTDQTVFALVLFESLMLSIVASAIGLVVAGGAFPVIFEMLGSPPFPMPPDVYVTGLGIAVVLAAVVAAGPAWRARRLSIAEAISGR